jgi:hypothetical protein
MPQKYRASLTKYEECRGGTDPTIRVGVLIVGVEPHTWVIRVQVEWIAIRAYGCGLILYCNRDRHISRDIHSALVPVLWSACPIPVTDETTDFSMYWYFSCHTLTRIFPWNSRSDRDTDYAWVGDSHPLLHERYSEDTLYKNAKSQNQKLKKAPTTVEAIKIQIPNTYEAERRLEEAPIPTFE